MEYYLIASGEEHKKIDLYHNSMIENSLPNICCQALFITVNPAGIWPLASGIKDSN